MKNKHATMWWQALTGNDKYGQLGYEDIVEDGLRRGQEQFFYDSRMPFVECRCSRMSERRFRPHLHQRFCVGAVLEGEVAYLIDGHQLVLRPGSLALINPEVVHACNEVDKAGPRSYAMLYLDATWCGALQSGDGQAGQCVSVASPVVQDASLYAGFCQLVDRLVDDQLHLLAKEEAVTEFCAALFGAVCGVVAGGRVVAGDIEWFKQVLATDLAEDFTLEQLAAPSGSNAYTLLRRFKKATGITPHAYRMNCRIEAARRLLQQGRDIAETAVECGFFDQSHLHRFFKAMTTVTPGEYSLNFRSS